MKVNVRERQKGANGESISGKVIVWPRKVV